VFQQIVLDTLVTGLPLIPMFLGVYIVLRLREDFDLTVQGSLALGAGVTAISMSHGAPAMLGIVLGVAAGGLAGVATSLIHLWLRIPVLMAGLVMNLALFTITLRVMGMPTISLIGRPTIFHELTSTSGPTTDAVVVVLLLVIVAIVLTSFGLFLKTEIGLALRASGVNARMVRSQGGNDNALLVLALVISNSLSAFSGALIVQVQGFADVNMGSGMFIAGAGAVLLGSLLLKPTGSRVIRTVLAVLIGGLLYQAIQISALRLGLPAGDLQAVTALTLILAVAAQRYLAPALSRYGVRLPSQPSAPQPELVPAPPVESRT
jgi:putative tryptophan/tyrosine transport system permease protein